LLRFGCFAGNGVVAAGEESEEGRKPFQIFPFAGLFSGGAWVHAPPLFLLSFGFTELVPTLLWIFEWLFCNFRIV
jgi:hypothetical protein